jgi:hypothetical protein
MCFPFSKFEIISENFNPLFLQALSGFNVK